MANTMTTTEFLSLTYQQLQRLDGEQFGSLLDSIPKTKWLSTLKPLLTGDRLQFLSTDAMEELLNRLPQAGPIRDRKPGALRVTSFGYNSMIEGKDWRCPYPFNFCIRLDGHQAAITLLINVVNTNGIPDPIRKSFGPRTSFIDVLYRVSEFTSPKDLQVILLKMFRPGTLTGWQWGTAGGTFTAAEEKTGAAAAGQRTFQETREEFKGFKIWGWMSLVAGQVYQSGNVFEVQYIGASIGHLAPDAEAGLAKNEGITDHIIIPLENIFGWFSEIDRQQASGKSVDGYDGKIHHGLLALSRQLRHPSYDIGF